NEWEGRREIAVIVELDQHRLSVGRHHRARRVTVVGGEWLLARGFSNQVVHDDGDLPFDARRRLSAWHSGNVTDRKDIRIAWVAQCRLLRFHPAIGGKRTVLPGQRAVHDRIRRAHGWYAMNKVVIKCDHALRRLIGCSFCARIDGLEDMAEIDGNVARGKHLRDAVMYGRNGKDRWVVGVINK